MSERKSTYPWDDWTEDQHREAQRQINLADGIKLYRAAGALGVGSQYAQYAQALEQQGGLTPEHATTLARYRMWKRTTGGDPGWQGPTNIPTGPREAPDTEDQVKARREALLKASPEERARIIASEKQAVDRSQEGFYDDLIAKQKTAQAASEKKGA